MSRARRIAQYLFDHPKGVGISQIRAGADPDASLGTIGAQLAQLIEAGKVRRTGAGRSALFFPTATVLVDKRCSKPKKLAKPKPKPDTAPPAAPKPKPAPVATTLPKRERSKHFAPAKPRLVAANAAPETVEEFLARGGRIQHCKPGECGQSAFGYHQQSAAHKERVRAETIAKQKAKARNQIDPDDDVDDLDAAA